VCCSRPVRLWPLHTHLTDALKGSAVITAVGRCPEHRFALIHAVHVTVSHKAWPLPQLVALRLAGAAGRCSREAKVQGQAAPRDRGRGARAGARHPRGAGAGRAVARHRPAHEGVPCGVLRCDATAGAATLHRLARHRLYWNLLPATWVKKCSEVATLAAHIGRELHNAMSCSEWDLALPTQCSHRLQSCTSSCSPPPLPPAPPPRLRQRPPAPPRSSPPCPPRRCASRMAI
jgi:hypothetical protein